jgi:MFS family permease
VNDGSAAIVRRILTAAFLRAVATGMVGVLLGLHLAKLGFGESTLGTISTLGLAGTALAAAIATFQGEQLGRRRFLIACTVLCAFGAAAVALGSGVWLLGIAAFVGMVNSAGRDRGAALILEQPLLAEHVAASGRTTLFARYNVAQDIGHAVGGLCAALPKLAQRALGEEGALRAGMATPALLFLGAAICAALLPRAIDHAPRHASALGARLSKESRPIVTRIALLFGFDSLGGGFLTTTLVTYWFFKRFDADVGTLGLLNAAARVLNALSHFGAAWLAKRIGLVNTMVFTHSPSSLLLIGTAFAPTFPIAATLFLLREGLVEMDVPTRQSYVLAIVKPEERTRVAGITTLVRMVAWAIAPVIGGFAMERWGLATPLYVGAAIKLVYDTLLYLACRKVRPPEERAPPSAAATSQPSSGSS